MGIVLYQEGKYIITFETSTMHASIYVCESVCVCTRERTNGELLGGNP